MQRTDVLYRLLELYWELRIRSTCNSKVNLPIGSRECGMRSDRRTAGVVLRLAEETTTADKIDSFLCVALAALTTPVISATLRNVRDAASETRRKCCVSMQHFVVNCAACIEHQREHCNHDCPYCLPQGDGNRLPGQPATVPPTRWDCLPALSDRFYPPSHRVSPLPSPSTLNRTLIRSWACLRPRPRPHPAAARPRPRPRIRPRIRPRPLGWSSWPTRRGRPRPRRPAAARRGRTWSRTPAEAKAGGGVSEKRVEQRVRSCTGNCRSMEWGGYNSRADPAETECSHLAATSARAAAAACARRRGSRAALCAVGAPDPRQRRLRQLGVLLDGHAHAPAPQAGLGVLAAIDGGRRTGRRLTNPAATAHTPG